ncbi:MAG: 6-bladed beta-propeller, partial [Vicinamibacterales bacterium]
MRRRILFSTLALAISAALITVSAQAPTPVSAPTDGGYKLVSNWPTMPPGDFFGLKTPPPPPAERDAQAAARRATGGGGGGNTNTGQGPTNQPGISGLAIDQHDRIYVFNRGVKPVMVFNTDGKMIASGGDQEINGKKINPNWQHSGTVDWDGNVYIIERDAHRIVKLNPKMDTFLMQLGTTNTKGTDATHFDLPSGIAVLKNGNIIVTDGYGNNRVVLFDKSGKFIKQVAKGAGGPTDKGNGIGEWVLPHKLAVDVQENLYIIDREGHRVQVFD